MKKVSLILLILFIVSCKQEEKSQHTVVSGTVENNDAQTVVIRGNGFEQKTPINETGAFLDTLNLLSDGFYELYVGRERTGIYLEKGKSLKVTLDAAEFDETLSYTGDLGNINNFLAAKYMWNEKNLDYKDIFSKDEKSFIEKLDQNQKSYDSLYNANAIKDENFKTKLAEEDTYSRAIMIESYKEAHKYYNGLPEFEVSEGFYEALKTINYKDTLAYRNSIAYQNLLDTHYNRLASEEAKSNPDAKHAITFLKMIDTNLPDGYAKDKIMASFLQFGLKADETLEEAYTIYKNSNPNAESLEKLTERYNKLKLLTKGNPSPVFDFENHKGGTTSLESLKGNYVYIDVWATWCGPCLREIPALKEVEKDYHDKNIKFVSISIDIPKDYEKWKTMVTEKELSGIQLISDNNWKSTFVQEYDILGIPRFILIDPQGNIVSSDAPRPSDSELRKTFDELL